MSSGGIQSGDFKVTAYHYEGLDSKGHLVAGTVEAYSTEAAVQQARERGVFVQRCRRVGSGRSAAATQEDDGEADASHLSTDDAITPTKGSGGRTAAVILSLFTLGGLFFALLGSWNVWEMARQLDRAVKTRGTVLASAIQREDSTDTKARGRSTTYFVPVVQYRYAVFGKTFTNDQLYPGAFQVRGPSDTNRNSAARLLREFPPGAEIDVWYLPHEPQTAFLKPVRILNNGLLTIVGAILSVAGAGFLLTQLTRQCSTRFSWALGMFLVSQSITWLLGTAYLTAPRVQIVGSLPMLQWLLLAYVVVCWTALIAHAPPQLSKVREATMASVIFGTIAMSLSLFILFPVTLLAPKWNAMLLFPWIGVGSAVLVLGLWMCGRVTVGK